MKRIRVQGANITLYGVFMAGVGLLSLLNVLGYVRLESSNQDNSVAGGRLRTERLNVSRRTSSLSTNVVQRQSNPGSANIGSIPSDMRKRYAESKPQLIPSKAVENSIQGWGLYLSTIDASSGDRHGLDEGDLSPPQNVLLEYIKLHSADAMRNESPGQFKERKFSIAYYSCPHQLGNRFFHFMNDVVWGVITNRTVLFKYLDTNTCKQLKETQLALYLDDTICNAANRMEDCDAILERAPWLPSFDEFGNSSWNIDRVDFWQTHWFRMSEQWIRSRYPFDESIHSNMTKVDLITSKLVEFPAQTNVETAQLTSRFTRQELLATTDARITARKLANKGLRFVYGMLYTELFRLRKEEAEAVKAYYPTIGADSSVFSISLHSRHKFVKNTGRNIQHEKDCLVKVLANRPKDFACRVCAMSDRPLALEKLDEWLAKEYQCKLVRVEHATTVNSFSVEHGPNAGAGFARELDVCHKYGSHAVVTTSTGSGASSSALLEALVDYNNNKNYGQRSKANRTEVQYCNAYST